MTVRRYRVNGEAPEGFRMKYSDALEAHSFRDPASLTHREEVVGWVETENMLYQNFADINRWFWEPYAMFSLRMDKKVLPVKWVRALQDQRVREWCENLGARPDAVPRGGGLQKLVAEFTPPPPPPPPPPPRRRWGGPGTQAASPVLQRQSYLLPCGT